MLNLITRVGELERKANLHNYIPDLVLLANGENIDNTEVEVVTLLQAERDIANEAAWLDLSLHTLNEVENKIEQILNDRNEAMHEFVHVQQDKIVVGVDCDHIDDAATDKAIMMLVQMDSFEIDTYRIFGDVK